jgi:phosphate transport system substrate-binding protein
MASSCSATGETDIQDASRPIEDEEKTACDKGGVQYVELAVAFDGITVMTNPANGDVTCLNKGDLYSLFGPESDGIDTWDGADSLAQQVGGTDNFPSAPLEITAPGRSPGPTTRSSSSPASRTRRSRRACPRTRQRPCGRTTTPRRTTTRSSRDGGSDSPLGFVGFAFAENAGDQVKILQVDGGDGCIEPTRDTIADQSTRSRARCTST